MSIKPVVHYTGPVEYVDVAVPEEVAGLYTDIMNLEGSISIARVYGVLDHPKLGKERMVRTSAIVNKFDGGFETLNTIYMKVEDEQDTD
jgi:hypothetical protein